MGRARKGKATGAATGATTDTAATAKADQNKKGRTITGSGEGADDDGDGEFELSDDDDDDKGISPVKAVRKEALLSHDMNYAAENNAEYENGTSDCDQCRLRYRIRLLQDVKRGRTIILSS